MKAKDLFSFLLLVPFLILAGCGGGTGSDSAALPAGVTLVSIAVTPGNPSIPVGATKQFAASGILSDGTSHDISTQVTWSSSNAPVATVNSSGLATAVGGVGTSSITAASGSISGTTTLQ